MNSKRRFLPVLALWLLGTLSVVAQDFQITSFKENMMDLRAASASIRDKNGDKCALIIFSVRDEHFEFEPNMGIVKQEKRAGETWLFVPQQTKRITIRHPQLGVLRDYVIPVNIEKKVVYEAELQITNQDYLSSLLHRSKIDTVRIMVPQEPTVVEVEAERNVHLDLGLGFSALGIMGPTGHIGFNIGHHLIEAGMTFGISKVWDVSIFQADNAAYWGTYDYSAMRFFARYGYNIEASSFIITPLLGAAINGVQGWETLALPFNVQKVEHSREGVLVPFPHYNRANTAERPYWLYTYGESGFERSANIDANRAYIICMPNNAEYDSEYRLNGQVTFSSQDVTVQSSLWNCGQRKGDKEFCPAFCLQKQSAEVYALNVINDLHNETGNRVPGSAFISNLRAVSPFEAYMTTTTGGSRVIDIEFNDVTGIGFLSDTNILSSRQRIYSLTGQLVFQSDSREEFQQVLRKLPAGVYIINGRKQQIK